LSAGSVDAHDANPSSSASFKRHHSKTFFSPTKSKWVAPDAQFLDLLQLRADMENRKLGPKLLLKRSTNGVLKTPQEGVDTVPMTLADGSRVYVRCRTTNTTAASSDNSSQAGCSLGVSMRELMRRVDGIKRQRLAIRHRLHSKNATTPKAMLDHGDLWVDRHAPASFPHLLSDERTNREVLRALRAWDPYVFGRKQPSRPTNHVLFHQQQGGIDASSKGGDQDNSSSKTPSNPLDKRPEESRRVILLSGPPGVGKAGDSECCAFGLVISVELVFVFLSDDSHSCAFVDVNSKTAGKTTLAHIVARHAGYRPLEVNASDERSASVLTDRIQRAMESTTIKLTSDGDKNDYGKPNCLILDEIDGADAKGAIQALVDIVKADMPSKNTKQKSSYLRRPIICICNHKYAPALRPLLPFAVQFNVDPPSSARLVARLKSILNKESLSMMAGGSLLHQLVVSTGGDIRSCLFTLQFAAAEAESSKDLSQALASSLSGTGLKDDRSDIASTITTVFRKVKSKAIESTRASLSSRRSNDRVSVSRVIDAVEGFGDDSTAVNALFMNILRVSYIDPAFDRCSAAHELLSAADLSQGSGYSMQRVFTPPMAAGIHLLCRVEVKPKLNFSSREMADAHFQLESNQALIQKFSEGLPTKAKNLKCRDLLSKEFIPMILWVLSAGEGAASLCRAASSIDILTKVEREIANNHVAALCALGLTYIPDNEEQINNKPSFRMDTTAMRLEPPIHRLVHYNFLKRPGGLRRKEIPATMKELLAHQVRLESFRIRDEAGETSATPPDVDSKESRNGHLSANIGASKSADHNTLTMETEPSPSKFTPRKLEQIAASIPAAKRTKVRSLGNAV
jgi:chromosome transmission fidelity protein 18